MKKFNFILIAIFSLILTSCNFTENIKVYPDGTGTFALEMDGAGLMAMAGDKIGKEFGTKKDAKVIDSTFSFKQIFELKNDSISKLSVEQQEALKKLENFVLRIKMNSESKQLLFSMNTKFNSVNELDEFMGNMSALKDLKEKTNQKDNTAAMLSSLGVKNTKLNFSYDGKNFTRKAIVLKDQIKSTSSADSLGMAKMFFASSKYTFKYHFPKPVKSVSNPDALFSADRKTITLEFPFTDYTENPEKLNFDIVFE
jgi:hypothetical protein